MKPREERQLWGCLLASLVIILVVYTLLTWWVAPPGQATLPPQPK